MTVPHLMNCSHSTDGWCLDCVVALGNENWSLREEVEALRSFNLKDIETIREVDGENDRLRAENERWQEVATLLADERNSLRTYRNDMHDTFNQLAAEVGGAVGADELLAKVKSLHAEVEELRYALEVLTREAKMVEVTHPSSRLNDAIDTASEALTRDYTK
jgi:DNA repair ATPase RecN